ncbi:MAG: hypothetical protein ACOCV2_14300, partial [Persicimonas sp.]
MQSRAIRTITCVCSLAVAALALLGSTSEAAAETVLEGGEVHTVAGEVIEDGVVVFDDDGTISRVGGPDTEVPEGAEVIDVSDQVVTPGLVEAHSQIGLTEIWSVGSTVDVNAGAGGVIRAAFRATDGFNQNSVVVPFARGGGITSAVLMPFGGLVSGQAGWVRLGPEASADNGAAAHVDRQTVAMVINHGDRGAEAVGRARGAATEKLRELYDDVRYFQDRMGDYNENRMRDLVASRLDMIAMSETLEGLPVVFRVNRGSDISVVLRMADEFGIEPIIVGGAE